MYCGSSWRPPRRTAIAGRLVLLCTLILLALAVSAGPASAYSCGATSQAAPARTLAGHVVNRKDCEEEPTRPAKRGNADPMSFMFFIGILLAVVLVPVALGRREDLPPE
jgi:hypothetical protein